MSDFAPMRAGPFYDEQTLSRLQELNPEDQESTLTALASVYESLLATLKDVPDDQPVPLGKMLTKVGEAMDLDPDDPFWVTINDGQYQAAGVVRQLAQEGLIEMGHLPAEPLTVFDGGRRRRR